MDCDADTDDIGYKYKIFVGRRIIRAIFSLQNQPEDQCSAE